MRVFLGIVALGAVTVVSVALARAIDAMDHWLEQRMFTRSLREIAATRKAREETP